MLKVVIEKMLKSGKQLQSTRKALSHFTLTCIWLEIESSYLVKTNKRVLLLLLSQKNRLQM